MCVASVHICSLQNSWEADPLWWTHLKWLFLNLSNYTSSLSLKLSVFYVADRDFNELPFFSFPDFSSSTFQFSSWGSGLGLSLLGLEVGLPGPAREPWPPYKASFVTELLDHEETHQSTEFLRQLMGALTNVWSIFTRHPDFLTRFLWLHSQHFPILTLEHLGESSRK